MVIVYHKFANPTRVGRGTSNGAGIALKFAGCTETQIPQSGANARKGRYTAAFGCLLSFYYTKKEAVCIVYFFLFQKK